MVVVGGAAERRCENLPGLCEEQQGERWAQADGGWGWGGRCCLSSGADWDFLGKTKALGFYLDCGGRHGLLSREGGGFHSSWSFLTDAVLLNFVPLKRGILG